MKCLMSIMQHCGRQSDKDADDKADNESERLSHVSQRNLQIIPTVFCRSPDHSSSSFVEEVQEGQISWNRIMARSIVIKPIITWCNALGL
jgi:hypothetical protein